MSNSAPANPPPPAHPSGSTPPPAGKAPNPPGVTTGPAPVVPAPRKNRLGLWLVLAVLAVVGGYYGYRYYQFAMTHETTDDATIEAHVVYIAPRIAGHIATVNVVENQWVKAGQVLATLDPRDADNALIAAHSALASAEAARDAAKADLALTTARATAALEAAKAKRAVAQAQAATAEAEAAGVKAQEAQAGMMIQLGQKMIDASKADVVSAKIELDRDTADQKRYETLAAHESVGKQMADHAVATAQISAAKLQSAEENEATREAGGRVALAAMKVAQLHTQTAATQTQAQQAAVGAADAEVAAAQTVTEQVNAAQARVKQSDAAVEQARAQVDKAELFLAYTKILAPSDGKITRKSVEPGAYLQPGQAMLALVSREVWVTANFKETQLSDMGPGQPVAVYVDAYPGIAFHAHIGSIQRGTGSRFALLPPENATGNYVKVVQRVPVKILFDDPEQQKDHWLLPGMSVNPEVDITVAPKSGPADPSTPPDEAPRPADAATPAAPATPAVPAAAGNGTAPAQAR